MLLLDSLSGEKLQMEQMPMNMQHHQRGETEITWEDSYSQHEVLVPKNRSENSLNSDLRTQYNTHMR